MAPGATSCVSEEKVGMMVEVRVDQRRRGTRARGARQARET